MKRSGMPRAEIFALRKAYRMIFDRARPVGENLGTCERQFGSSAHRPRRLDFFADARQAATLSCRRCARAHDSDDDDELRGPAVFSCESGDRIAIVAGSGRLPVDLAESLAAHGHRPSS